MKIHINILLMLTLSVVAGCTMEERFEGSNQLSGKEKLTGQEIVIRATREEGPETKTARNEVNGAVLWTPGDAISLFYGSGTNGGSRFASDATELCDVTNFTGTITAITGGANISLEDTYFWGIYPYSDDISCDGTYVTMTLPTQQTAVPGTFATGLFPSIGRSQGLMMGFYNVCGGWRFSVTKEGLRKVTLKSNGGELITGKVKVRLNDAGIPTVAEIIEGSDEVVLECPQGEYFEVGQNYYMVLLPGTMASGFTMTFETYTEEGVYNRTASTTINRSGFIGVTNLDNYLTTPYTQKTGNIPIPDAIDLGLPSGLKWASFNVGASSSEEFGDYYAWGETEPKNNYDWTTYMWGNGSSFTKYGYDGNITVLETGPNGDDVASKNLGEKWRMPTDEDWEELMDECTWTWTTQNEVNGYFVSGPNGNSIFLPAAGYRYRDYCSSLGVYGNYYSSSLYSSSNPVFAKYVSFNSDNISRIVQGREFGMSVRPVYGDIVHPESVTLNKSSLSLTKGAYYQLTATISPINVAEKSITWSSSNNSVVTVSSSGVVSTKAAGTAEITVTTIDGEITAKCSVSVNTQVSVPTAIDLGLSVKWASFNIGSSTPEGYGTYYAWGETETKYYHEYGGWEHYHFCSAMEPYSLVKYNTISDYGTVDNKTVLMAGPDGDDVSSRVFGGTWRMPTDDEWTELRENCTWKWANLDGVNGYLVTGTNGNSIFLPTVGICDGFFYPISVGVAGNYWSSSLDINSPRYAWGIYICPKQNEVERSERYRYYGMPVRPVYGDIVNPESVTLNKSSLLLTVGASFQLTASLYPANTTANTVTWSSSNNSVVTVSSSGVVSAKATGTAEITVTTIDGEITAKCSVSVNTQVSVPTAIDLGLSVKWASFNIGSSTPEGYGTYYAWGETETKHDFSQSTYIWYDGFYYTKYNTNEYFDYVVDNYTVLETGYNGDDVASKMLGGTWRIPTDDEWTELRENCTWKWANQDGVNGYLVTSTNGNSIFLPAAGYRLGTDLYDAGSYGDFWSSSLYARTPSFAQRVYFSSRSIGRNSSYRFYGFSVRPITE